MMRTPAHKICPKQASKQAVRRPSRSHLYNFPTNPIVRLRSPQIMSLEGDDFWQASSIKPFDFDDEEKQLPPVKTPESVLSVKPTNEPFLRPSIITCQKRLDLIEHLAKEVPDVRTSPAKQDPKMYILDIVNKQISIDFSPYKSKSEKMALLDAAICCYDGNVITAVTIFLSKTLKESIFDEELQKRPIAMDHHRSFLRLSKTR